jgi:phosphatidylglycerol---prolipoprotein diacylglyceryl transferase
MHPFLYKFVLFGRTFPIPAYGFMLAIGIVLGIYLAKKEAIRSGVDPQTIESFAFWVVVTSVLGSRFLYTFVEHGDHYWKHPIEFFYFHKGGLAFSGSLVTAIITAIVFSKKKNISIWKLLDIITPPVSLGLFFGKMGCFLAGCCYGKVCDLPWGVAFNHPQTLAEPRGIPLHPTQLYEGAAWLLLFFILYKYQLKNPKTGVVFALFALSYGVVRFILEYFRADPGHISGLTTAQFFNIPLVIAAIALLLARRRA